MTLVFSGFSFILHLAHHFANFRRSLRKRGKLKFKVDLTKRRNDLLRKARDLTENIAAIQYVFSDVNCRLNVRFQDDSVKGFNSETELAQFISSCDEH